MVYNINADLANMTTITKNGIRVEESTISRWLREISLKGDIIILKEF